MINAMANAVADGNCVLFAGAGISRDAGIPTWADLGESLKNRLANDGLLAGPILEAVSALIAQQDVAQAMELMEATALRKEVIRALRQILTPSGTSAVCSLLQGLKLRGVVTTNYDRVVNTIVPGDSYVLTNSLGDLKIVPTAVSTSTFLLKLHGDLDNELGPLDPLVARGESFMVLSAKDYAALLQGERGESIVRALHSILQEHSVLFLGYSLRDPDITWFLNHLSDWCQFSQTSWYLGLKGEPAPSLPTNVIPFMDVDGWDHLPEWLENLAERVNAATTTKSKTLAPEHPKHPTLTDEGQRAFRSVIKYLADLESGNISERVLSSAVIDDVAQTEEFTCDWLTERISALLDVGRSFAEAFSVATASFLVSRGIVEDIGDGRLRPVKAAIETLAKRATDDWVMDRTAFYTSVWKRMGSGLTGSAAFEEKLDIVLEEIYIHSGLQMARWIHRGLAEELDWSNVDDALNRHFTDEQESRRAHELLELLFDQPSDDEIPYLYRLLAAAFLASSVRLEPSAARFVGSALASYELYLDSNVLLPLLVEEHHDHSWISDLVKLSREAGARCFVLSPIREEIIAHRDLAQQQYDECAGDLTCLREAVNIFGRRANCFIQGYVKLATAGPTKWAEYLGRYAPSLIDERLEQLGVQIVHCSKDEHKDDYAQILLLIENEWSRRSQGSQRARILNENEARQFSHIYHRRRELTDRAQAPEAWFLSYETVLAQVFKRDANRWRMPPTFPVSAWAVFVDSRIGWVDKNRPTIVKAILRGNWSAFQLPDPIAIVRKHAFGDRVLSEVEDAALRLTFSDFYLVDRVNKARTAILSRGITTGAATESGETIQAAVAAVDTGLHDLVDKLQSSLETERDQRRKLEGQVKDLTTKLDESSSQRVARSEDLRSPPFKKRRRKG